MTDQKTKKDIKATLFMAPVLNHGGGCELSFMKIAEYLSYKDKYESVVITFTRNFYTKLVFLISLFHRSKNTKYGAVRLSDSEVRNLLGKAKWLEVPVLKAKRLLDESNVVYTKNEILDLFFIKLFRLRTPVICAIRSPIYFPITSSFYSIFHNFLYKNWVYKWLLKSCRVFHVLNNDDKKLIQDLMGKKVKIFLIPNAVNINFFVPSDNCEKDEFKILFVGRLCEQKGIDYLIDIIKKVSSESDKICFTLVGEGTISILQRLETLERECSNIVLRSKVNKEEMAKLYQGHDLVIIPSRWETFNLITLEAQSCSLPVISFNIPGPRDIIVDNKTGFLVPAGDVDKFVDRILLLYKLKLTDLQKFLEWKRLSRENAIKSFSPSKIYSDIDRMFRSLGNV